MEVYETARDKKKVQKISKEDMKEVEREIKEIERKLNEPDIWDEVMETFVDGLKIGTNLVIKLGIFMLLLWIVSYILNFAFGEVISDMGLGRFGILIWSFITTIIIINTNHSLKIGFKYGFLR